MNEWMVFTRILVFEFYTLKDKDQGYKCEGVFKNLRPFWTFMSLVWVREITSVIKKQTFLMFF